MEELENANVEPVEEVNESPPIEAPQEAPAEEVSEEEIFDITKDARWEKDWKKDINNVYKSLKGYDKSYTPLQMAIKKHGINDPTELEKALEEYKSLKDPENDMNKFVDYINPLLENEDDLNWFKKTIDGKLQEMKFRGLDENLPPEYKQAIIDGKEAKIKAEELERKLEVKEISEKIESSIKEIESYAKENNLDFNKGEFINYCREKNVPSNLLMDVFQAQAKPFIINNETRKAEDKLLKNQEANKKGGIVSGDRVSPPASKTENLMTGLDRILNR